MNCGDKWCVLTHLQQVTPQLYRRLFRKAKAAMIFFLTSEYDFDKCPHNIWEMQMCKQKNAYFVAYVSARCLIYVGSDRDHNWVATCWCAGIAVVLGSN